MLIIHVYKLKITHKLKGMANVDIIQILTLPVVHHQSRPHYRNIHFLKLPNICDTQ